MCFMEIKSENEIQSLDDESRPTSNELQDTLKSLYDEFKKLDSKYSYCKNKYVCLLVEKETLEKKACIVIYDSNKINQLKIKINL